MEPPVPAPAELLANRVLSLDGEGDPFAAYAALGAETPRGAARPAARATGRARAAGCSTSGAAPAARCATSSREAAGRRDLGLRTSIAESIELAAGLTSARRCTPCAAATAPAARASRPAAFDLVWAISVFTHLTDASAAVAARAASHPEARRPADRRLHGRAGPRTTLAGEPWDEDRIGMNVLRHANGWDAGRPDGPHRPTGGSRRTGAARSRSSRSPRSSMGRAGRCCAGATSR